MDKALIEKAFEKWWYLKYKDLMIEYDYIKDLGERKLKVNYWHSYCRQAFIAGATWQREQLEAKIKELEANQIKGRCKECKFISCCDTYLKADCNCSQFEPKEAVKEGKI